MKQKVVKLFRFGKRADTLSAGQYDPVAAYQRHLDSKLELYGAVRDLAFAQAIGLGGPLCRY